MDEKLIINFMWPNEFACVIFMVSKNSLAVKKACPIKENQLVLRMYIVATASDTRLWPSSCRSQKLETSINVLPSKNQALCEYCTHGK